MGDDLAREVQRQRYRMSGIPIETFNMEERTMADNVKSTAKSGIDDAASGAKNLVDRGANVVNRAAGNASGTGTMESARDTLHNVAEKAGEYAHQARAKVGEWAGQAGQQAEKWAEDAYEVTSERVGDFGREVTNLVRRHPLPAILIGFGVGLLMGRVARIV
jgi:ElaB/YqjD/DUF883 family membrane-anchored ribosome-binding protein